MMWTSLLRRSPLGASAAGAVLLATAVLLWPTSAARAANCQKGEDETGLVPLFNGTTLDGWSGRSIQPTRTSSRLT